MGNYIPTDESPIISACDKIRKSVENKFPTETDLNPQSYLWQIYENKVPGFLTGLSILDIVYKLTVGYYLFGTEFRATSPNALTLVDSGRWVANLIVT